MVVIKIFFLCCKFDVVIVGVGGFGLCVVL